MKEWLREWLGIGATSRALIQHVDDTAKHFDLEKEQRRRDILNSQGFVPLMNQRIEALEQTSVNGAGAEAIVVGSLEAYDLKAKRYFAQVETEVADLTREIEDLKKWQRDVIVKEAITPKPREEKKPEPAGRKTWPQRRAAIEEQERQKADKVESRLV